MWGFNQFTAWTSLGLVLGLNTSLRAQDDVDLTFGVYTTDKPTVMYKKFSPVLEALELAMERALKRSVAIEIKIIKSYSAARTQLITGKVDFVRFGPASYVLAKQENPRIELLAMETKQGKKSFKGYIVVRADSPVRKVEELKGRKFAFGDETSTIGRYLAQEVLVRASVYADSLKAHRFLGRHDKVFRVVQLGDFHAGALKKGTFDKLNRASRKEDRLRILASFDNVTKPWVAREGLPAEIQNALGQALRSLKDAEALKQLKSDKLVVANDRDYDVIRKSMRASLHFERLESRPAPGK